MAHSTDCRAQLLSNAKCLYRSEIEVLTFSYKTSQDTMYQAAVMKRLDYSSPWVNVLYGEASSSSPGAVRELLQKTEEELAKHLTREGVTFPLTGDTAQGFVVTGPVRKGSVISLSDQGSDGSEFEFVATPASSSAGDFSEDEVVEEENDEKDTDVGHPVPTPQESKPVQPVQLQEETSHEAEIPTIPVQVPTDPILESHPWRSSGRSTFEEQDNKSNTEPKEEATRVEIAETADKPTLNDFHWGSPTNMSNIEPKEGAVPGDFAKTRTSGRTLNGNSWASYKTKSTTKPKSGETRVEIATDTADTAWDDWNWGSKPKKKNKKKVTRTIREEHPKMDPWSAVVEELEERVERMRDGSNQSKIKTDEPPVNPIKGYPVSPLRTGHDIWGLWASNEHKPEGKVDDGQTSKGDGTPLAALPTRLSKFMPETTTLPVGAKDEWDDWVARAEKQTWKGKEKEAIGDGSFDRHSSKSPSTAANQASFKPTPRIDQQSPKQWSFSNIPYPKSQAVQQSVNAKPNAKFGNTVDVSKVHHTLSEWMNYGIPPEKLEMLQDLVGGSSSSNAERSSLVPGSIPGQLSNPKKTTVESTDDEWAIWAAALDEKEKKEHELKLDSPASHGSQGQPPIILETASPEVVTHIPSDLSIPQNTPGAWPTVALDSWGSWPVPARKKKPKKTLSGFPGDALPEKSASSDLNPWATRNAPEKTTASVREPEAVLDEYDSSRWGTFKSNKQKSPTVPGPRLDRISPSVGFWDYPPKIAEAKINVALDNIPPFPKLELAATPTEISEVKPALNVCDWGQTRWGVATPNTQGSFPVILPKPEPVENSFNNQVEGKPKNPFESFAEPSKQLRSDSNAADDQYPKWGSFTTYPTSQLQDIKSSEVKVLPKVSESKISPWPYLEPESVPRAIASVSHQSLLDDLAEWGSFSKKEKTKKPVAFDYLDTALPLMAAPISRVDENSDVISSAPDDIGWSSKRKVSKKEKLRRVAADQITLKDGPTIPSPGNEPGFGTFVIKNKHKEASLSDADLEWEVFNQKKNADKHSSAVSEMSGDNAPATAPVPSFTQNKYRTNVLGLTEDSDTRPLSAPHSTLNKQRKVPFVEKDSSTPHLRLYVLNITYNHSLATEHFRNMLTISFTTKAAIVAEVNKFITPREPFGQIYNRKIEILSAKGEDGLIDLSALDELSWPDILGFLEDTTKVIDMTILVNDV